MKRKPKSNASSAGRGKTRGAEPERVSLHGMTFADAMKHAIRKPKPAEGWPKRERRAYKKRKSV